MGHRPVEFPRVDAAATGRLYRYAYAVEFRDFGPAGEPSRFCCAATTSRRARRSRRTSPATPGELCPSRVRWTPPRMTGGCWRFAMTGSWTGATSSSWTRTSSWHRRPSCSCRGGCPAGTGAGWRTEAGRPCARAERLRAEQTAAADRRGTGGGGGGDETVTRRLPMRRGCSPCWRLARVRRGRRRAPVAPIPRPGRVRRAPEGARPPTRIGPDTNALEGGRPPAASSPVIAEDRLFLTGYEGGKLLTSRTAGPTGPNSGGRRPRPGRSSRSRRPRAARPPAPRRPTASGWSSTAPTAGLLRPRREGAVEVPSQAPVTYAGFGTGLAGAADGRVIFLRDLQRGGRLLCL